MDAIYDWVHRHPTLVDFFGALALYLVLGLAANSELTAYQGGDTVLGKAIRWAVTIGLIAPLIWRRRFPVACFTAVSLTCAVQLVVARGPVAADVAFLLALYALSARARSRIVRLAGLGVGLLGAVLALFDWSYATLSNVQAEGRTLAVFGLLIAVVVVTWIAGDLMRNRRAVAVRLREQNLALERDSDQRTRLVAQEERSRIAREMHDIIAHSLSVIVVQADGGAYAVRHAAQRRAREMAGTVPDPATQPLGSAQPLDSAQPIDSAQSLGSGQPPLPDVVSTAAAALDTIASTARQALSETRRLVGVLRDADTDTDAELAPQAGMDQVPELISGVVDAGVPVTFWQNGTRRDLPRGVDLAAYRVVQESLTNVLKHAGPDARAEVVVDYHPTQLVIAVTDDGRGAAAAPDDAGHGVIGMRERMSYLGGHLMAGPVSGGGFRVHAVLPTEGSNKEAT